MNTPHHDTVAKYIADSISAEYVAEAERLYYRVTSAEKRADDAEEKARTADAVLTETRHQLGSTRHLYNLQLKAVAELEEFKKRVQKDSAEHVDWWPYTLITGLMVGGLCVAWVCTLR
jgi:hypothetical protein